MEMYHRRYVCWLFRLFSISYIDWRLFNGGLDENFYDIPTPFHSINGSTLSKLSIELFYVEYSSNETLANRPKEIHLTNVVYMTFLNEMVHI